jgi:hypothetical protein
MADFCNICTAFMYNPDDANSDNIGSILMNYRVLQGGDISIDRIFLKYMLPDLNTYINDENICISVDGICEHCGLVRLSVKKEVVDDKQTLYLIAWCYSSDDKPLKDYKIATISNNELQYDEEVLLKYYNGEK